MGHMTELRRLAASSEEPATNAGRFLAKRGHVVMKQFHEIGTLKCDLGTKLTFTTLVFAIAQGAKGDRTFGLKIEHETRNGRNESCLVDHDELKELLLAIKYLVGLAKQTAGERNDYTEFSYVTRDSLMTGFFQDSDGRQQAFFDVRPGGEMMFLSLEQLRAVFELIKKGREYLIEKGAEVDTVVTQQEA
jgi:hypothetical protein